ncbi:fibroblast growth factor 14-like protein [Lates japonicus]|uniref:Fibroblast growth factor 14-like protein n=1 Tax=Lates japonicus TaxID=270547 RepID=A0AAD3RLI4_LATJO|nr:fibroblast growth factor 14-like protein [Lates japonicus]
MLWVTLASFTQLERLMTARATRAFYQRNTNGRLQRRAGCFLKAFSFSEWTQLERLETRTERGCFVSAVSAEHGSSHRQRFDPAEATGEEQHAHRPTAHRRRKSPGKRGLCNGNLIDIFSKSDVWLEEEATGDKIFSSLPIPPHPSFPFWRDQTTSDSSPRSPLFVTPPPTHPSPPFFSRSSPHRPPLLHPVLTRAP